MSLLQRLQQRLNQIKELTFTEFMQLALYAPGDGYYESGLTKFGKEGDFITAPELTHLFGKTLANQCHQILQQVETPVVFEYGAGSGVLCVDVLSHLDEMNHLPERYYILEVSSNLKHRQKELIQQKIPHLEDLVIWVDSWLDKPMQGVIIANEVLDAMPVHRFMYTEQGIMESYVSLDAENNLVEHFKPCTNNQLLAYIQNHLTLQAPYLSEVNLCVDDWMLNNSKMLEKGAMILMDYGFPRQEYYHPDRNQGTLMCHYRHQAHSNPLLYPGEQDITAHVDFTHLAEAGQQAGLHVAGFTNQASFLLANGLLSLIHHIKDEKELFAAKQAIKQLTQPNEMGELFKVIALTKNLDLELNGFLLNDKRVKL